MKPKYHRISVVRFAQSLLPRFQEVIREEDISSLALALLYELDLLETEPAPVGLPVLRRALSTDASTMSRELRKLAKRKLIVRYSGSKDARFRMIRLTKQGRQLLDRVEGGLMFGKDDGPIVPGDREHLAWERVGPVSVAIASDQRRVNRDTAPSMSLFDPEVSGD